MATRGYIGAHFTFYEESVLIITSDGMVLQTGKDFCKTTKELLQTVQEKQMMFVEPEDILQAGGLRYD